MSRIAIFSAQYLPHVGGIEYFTYNLSRELAARGDEVAIVTTQSGLEPGSVRDEDGVRVVRLPSYSFMDGRLPINKKNACHRELLADLVASGVDRVLVNARFYRNTTVGLDFAARTGASCVVLDHGSAHLTLGSAVADVPVQAYEHFMTRRAVARKPVFAGISHASCEWLRHFGIDTDLVIPNAIDAEAFRSARSDRDFRFELGLGADAKIVAFVGRLTPEKGPDKLVQAARDHAEAQFLLAGEGALRSALEDEDLTNLHLLGNLDRPDLSALLSQSDVFCLPTRSEGFCTSLLESSTWGVPPVMPRVGGVDEVVADPAWGHILDDVRPESVSAGIGEVLSRDGKRLAFDSSALRRHVETECSWSHSVTLLDVAFNAAALMK